MEKFIPQKRGISGYKGDKLNILGIETSCDETAAAVCTNGRILSNIISSQKIHQSFGGVVPELASREHERLLNSLVFQAIEEAGISLSSLEGIAVTKGPGLAGTLLAGVCFSKGLAQGLRIPVIGINHLEAHIFASFLENPNLRYPFICLLVSGGHTQVWLINKIGKYKLMGETRDDAAGEAFDKGARILGLGYPGGPEIEKLARNGNPKTIDFPKSFMKTKEIEFSFSGLKTSLLYYMDQFDDSDGNISIADVAASYQNAIIEVLIHKLKQTLEITNIKTCVIAGGVAANNQLRKKAHQTLPDISLSFPGLVYCTDNAAMVAFLGELKLKAGNTSPINFGIKPNLQLQT